LIQAKSARQHVNGLKPVLHSPPSEQEALTPVWLGGKDFHHSQDLLGKCGAISVNPSFGIGHCLIHKAGSFGRGCSVNGRHKEGGSCLHHRTACPVPFQRQLPIFEPADEDEAIPTGWIATGSIQREAAIQARGLTELGLQD
jgi:hypothetical protein